MEAVIQVEGLEKAYGAVRALRGVSFEVPAGQVLGFLGPNGAGKTTTMKILCGYLAADAGRARVQGIEVERDPVEVKRRIGYLPENNPLYPEQRVADFLGFCHAARHLPRRQRAGDLDRVVARTGLEAVFRRRIGECSKGYRQRVGLAQALLHDPPLLVLDEPTNGLDPLQAVEMRDLVRELGRTKTVILTSHVLPEVEALANRVVIVHQGRLAADLALEELRASSLNGDRLRVRVTVRAAAERLEELLLACGASSLEAREAGFGDDALASSEAALEGGSSVLERIASEAAARNLPLVELTPLGGSLAELFQRVAEGAEELTA